jgi:hypothetical protein
MYASVGRMDETARLFRVYGALYTRGLPEELRNRTTIAEIVNVADDANQTIEFTLAAPQKITDGARGRRGQEPEGGYDHHARGGKVPVALQVR